MSSKDISSREEMKIKIQEEIINRIKKQLEKDFKNIKFWLPCERISDEEIDKAYRTIYNTYVIYGSKMPKVLISKNFSAAKDPMYNRVYLNLELSTISLLKEWSRKAARIIDEYLTENGDYRLKEVRFDLLPDDSKEQFIIPNLPLCNIHFYYAFKKSVVVDDDEYVDEQISLRANKESELEAAQNFAAMVKSQQNKTST